MPTSFTSDGNFRINSIMNVKADEFIYRTLIAAPLVILFTVTVFPFFFVLSISLFNVKSYNLYSEWEFAGLQNYITIFNDGENIKAILNSILYIFYALGAEIFVGIVIALLLLYVNERYRTKIILPFMIPIFLSPSVVGMLWKQLLAYDGGLLNKALALVGVAPIAWLTPDPIFRHSVSLQQSLNLTYGSLSLLIVEVWQWSPIFVAMFLITFHLLQKEIIDSAVLDGASLFNIFRDIYFPMAKPLLYGLILLRIMDMLKVYETIWIFFGNSSIFSNINIRLVMIGLEFRNYSYCAAFSMVIFIVIMIILFFGRLLLDRAGKLYYD